MKLFIVALSVALVAPHAFGYKFFGRPKVRVRVTIGDASITCHNLKCKEKGVTPDFVDRAVEGTNNTIKRNSKFISKAGRAAACYYTAYCASEAYIAYKKHKASEDAQKQFKKYSETARSEAAKEGQAALDDFERKQLADLDELMKVRAELIENETIRLDALMETQAHLMHQQQLRRDWAEGAEHGVFPEPINGDLTKIALLKFQVETTKMSPESEATMRKTIADETLIIAESLKMDILEISDRILQTLSAQQIDIMLEAARAMTEEVSMPLSMTRFEHQQDQAKRDVLAARIAKKSEGK